ncbi:MAG: DUF4258 domain-containing protein [Betaproteobacteria bacterium HGW-Betaproteobacteria-8]|nr:MAG: DUF4258 domain-containing protein [Betaproteobacteria bacterium HGW-Betaproteobacteria-8]
MDFKLSDHAKKRMGKRKVKIEWVQAALDHPDIIENDKEDVRLAHALKAIPDRGFKVLKVVYNETTDPVTVVTVFFE